jgi:hypothetical protein
MSGCYPENFISDDVEGDKLAKELLTYLSEDDADGVKSMFCDRAKDFSELDQQIEEALEFFDGSVITEDRRARTLWFRISVNPDLLCNLSKSIEKMRAVRKSGQRILVCRFKKLRLAADQLHLSSAKFSVFVKKNSNQNAAYACCCQ